MYTLRKSTYKKNTPLVTKVLCYVYTKWTLGAEGEKPWYMSNEDSNEEKKKHAKNPQYYKQQEDATKARMESVGSSHLGSGGWDTFHVYFESINVYRVCFKFDVMLCLLFLCYGTFRIKWLVGGQ